MYYDPETISAEIIMESSEYVGVRLKLKGALGDMTNADMQIDINFTDDITPQPIDLVYTTMFDMPAPKLKGYPQESVIAEKLHIIVYRGSFNSRRKDYYDLWFISQHFDINGSNLKKAIINTFRNRKTNIPEILPVALSDEYAMSNQKQWQAFLSRFNPDNSEIVDFKYVIQSLRTFSLPPLTAASQNENFKSVWTPNKNQWV